MAGFPDGWIDELLSRADIVTVVSRYVTLKPRGGKLWGLCPFHNEKTPSFSVSPDKNLYYCFGCHAGGNAIGFVMAVENLPFPDAVRELAQSVGMDMPDYIDSEKQQRDREQRQRLLGATKEAALFFCKRLFSPDGKSAAAYLSRRGLDRELIQRFGLGYSPDAWTELSDHLLQLGFSKNELVAANLSNTKSESSFYDTFRNRVMFPIINSSREVIAFGARTMGDEQPKYLNTGDTPLFNKRNNLYAINLLKGTHPKDAVVVEGYMDVVGLHRFGVNNAVASLGTALTPHQARLLKRYTTNVFLSYDGDNAGQKATLRGIDILGAEGLNVRVITVPEQLDPDEFVGKYGAQAFDELKQTAIAPTAYKLKSIYAQFGDSPEQRQECAKQACKLLSALSPIEQETYLLDVSRATGFPANALRREIAQNTGEAPVITTTFTNYRYNRNKRPEISKERLITEQALVKLAFEYRDFARRLNTCLFKHEAHAAIISALLDSVSSSEAAVLAKLDETQAKAAASALMLPAADDPEICYERAVKTLTLLDLKDEKTALQLEAEQTETSVERRLECVDRIKEINSVLHAAERD